MAKVGARGVGRPGSPLGLTRPVVMAAALALVDREGLEALSLRRLGAELGVEAMTVHYHAGGKEGLLDGVVEAVLAEVVVPPLVAGELWTDRLRAFACACRTALLGHPHALSLVAVRPWQERGPRLSEALLAMLRRGGLGPVTAWHIARALNAYIVGQALMESYDRQALAGTSDHEPAQSENDKAPAPGVKDRATAGAAEFPLLATSLAARDPRRSDHDAAFATGLDALLAGLSRLGPGD